MRIMKIAISTDVYEKLKNKSGEELETEVCNILPSQYSCGYGIYHVQLRELNDYYYIELEVGNNCDQ